MYTRMYTYIYLSYKYRQRIHRLLFYDSMRDDALGNRRESVIIFDRAIT